MEQPDDIEEFVGMTQVAIDGLHSYMHNLSDNKQHAKKVKKEWMTSRIINSDSMFTEVAENSLLMKTVGRHLANGLPQQIEKSNFGLGMLTDHDLYFNGSTDKKLRVLLQSKNLNLTMPQFFNLAKLRDDLFKHVKNAKFLLLHDMELPGIYFSLFYNSIDKY